MCVCVSVCVLNGVTAGSRKWTLGRARANTMAALIKISLAISVCAEVAEVAGSLAKVG